MTIKGLMKTMAAGLLLLTVISCGGNKNIIDPKAMLAYGKEPNEQTIEVLSKSYSGVISKNRKSGTTTPGVYSDYAVMLVKQGKRAEANGWFNKEMEAFPSSRGYVMQLKRRLIPEYQDNNSTSAADADTAAAEPDALTPAQRKRAEKRAAAVLNDTTETATDTESANEMDGTTDTETATEIEGSAETETTSEIEDSTEIGTTNEATSVEQTDDEDMDRLSEPPATNNPEEEDNNTESPQQKTSQK